MARTMTIRNQWQAMVLNKRNRAPKIKGAVRPVRELKYVDTAVASYACNTTGSVTLLNGVAVGDDNTTRDGRQVLIKNVQVRGSLIPSDGTVLGTKCRVLLVWDNAASGSAATIAQILTAVNSNCFPLLDNAQRFTILKDWSWTAGPYDASTSLALISSTSQANIEWFKTIGCVTQYSGTGATIASIQNGALYLVTVGDQAAGSEYQCKVAVRVRFLDQ